MTAWQDLLVTQNILRAGSALQIDFYLHKAGLGKLAYLQIVYDQKERIERGEFQRNKTNFYKVELCSVKVRDR